MKPASPNNVIGCTLALTRSFRRIDAKLRKGEWESQWAVGAPLPR
jgi:phosphoglycerate dehydrogenase-like enzyme